MSRAARACFPLAVVTVLATTIGCTTDPAPTADDPDLGKADCPSCTTAPSVPVAARRANLYANLLAQLDTPATLFGQERFNITGVADDGTQWLATSGSLDRSDVHTLTGQHPVMMELDAWDLAMKPATWKPTGEVHAAAARAVYEAGGIVGLAWHMRGCVVDSFDAAGNEACLCRIANDDAFARTWLLDGGYAKLADALERFGLDDIPLVLRPLHEHNGGWFWWGEPYWNCTSYVASPRFTGAAAFERVFRTIVTYLRDERGLDNLLIAYAPGGNAALATEDGYLRGYPGDAYVDILGADLYYQHDPSFAEQTVSFRQQLATITRIARERGKVSALTEVGDTQIAFDAAPDQSRWFTEQLLPLVSAPGVDVAYALTWENRTRGDQQFWVPYTGHPGVADFRSFAASDSIAMLGETAPLFDAPASGYPVCGSCDADADGDRWGWENGRSCRVGSWCIDPQYPACGLCASDPDGDGWGWENARSCIAMATCH